MNLSPHVTVEEFTASDTAHRLGISNDLPESLRGEALKTAAMLERIRQHLGNVPIIVSSGYRCRAVNTAIGSGDTSDHIKAMAADIKVPAFGTPLQVARALVPVMDVLGIGQLIYEFGAWVHVSTRTPGKIINRILTINKQGTFAGIDQS